MDNPQGGEPIVREKLDLTWLRYVIALAVLLGLLGGLWWYMKTYYPGFLATTSEEMQDGVEFGSVDSVDEATAVALTDSYTQIIQTEQTTPFVYGIVPEASNRITIDAPDSSTVRDDEDYRVRATQISPYDKALAREDSVRSLVFDSGQTFTDVIDAHPQVAQLYQMQDEIMFVAHEFNARYSRPALKERIENVDAVTVAMSSPFDSTLPLTYPAGRAVNAFTLAAIMGKLDPTNAELYTASATGLAERGIAYGEYGISDLEAAKSLVDQYFSLVDFEIESGLEITW